MSVPKIALIGESEFFRDTLQGLLRENGCEAEILRPEDLQKADLSGCELTIVSEEVASAMEEEALLRLLLSAGEFLLVGEEKGPPPFSFIHELMSPEEVLSRVNGIIYAKRASSQGLPARSSPRVTVSVEVEYEFQGERHKSTIQTLSARGAFIATLRPLARDSAVKVSFELPGEGKIETLSRVLYSIGYDLEQGIIPHPGTSGRKIPALPGMAVLFEEMTEGEAEAIRAFVDRSLFD